MGKKNSLAEIKRFTEILSEELEHRFGAYPTLKDLLLHLSQNGIIKPITLRNYMIVQDFYSQLRKNKGHMMHTFMDMSIEYELSERQIQTIIYEYQKKFSHSENYYR
jgi:hypothetical protein